MRSRSSRRPRSSASPPRAVASRLPGASSCATRSRAGLDVENGLHEFLADDPELVRARGGARRRAPRPPPPAGGADRPERREPRAARQIVLTVGSDCAIGKMTVSLELDRAARARGLASQFVPTGQTGIAIAGWGIAVDAVVADFLAGAAERLVVEGARARGRAALRRGPGLADPSRVLGRHARARPRLRAARLRALPPGRPDGDRGLPGPPDPAARRARRAPRADRAAGPSAHGRRDRAEHAALDEDEARAAIAARRGRDRPCRPTTRFASAPVRLLDAVLAALARTRDRRRVEGPSRRASNSRSGPRVLRRKDRKRL